MTPYFVGTRRAACTLAAGLALTLASTLPSLAAARIQHLISPGGIEAWFVRDTTLPLIAMEFAFAGGTAQDPAKKSGVANLVADLLDEGAGELDSKAYHERLDRGAIEQSFSAGYDALHGSMRMLRDDKEEAFDLLRMALTSPRFDPADIERVRSQVIAGLRRDSTHPTSIANRKLFEIAFGSHPYGHHANGTLESVPTITVADIKDYVGRVVAKDTLKIAVVGDIEPATLAKLLDQTFGGLPARANLTPTPDIEVASSPQRALVPLDLPQTVIAFGGPGVKRSDPRFMAAYIVNHILGGNGLSSRLFYEVREKRGLAYSIYETLLWMEHSAMFVGNTGTSADRASETIDALENEIRRIAEHGPTQKELDEAKSYLKGSQMLPLASSTQLAEVLLQYQVDKLPIDYIEKRSAIIDAVTLDDAREAAERLWSHGLLTVVVGRTLQAVTESAAAAPLTARD